MKPDASLTSSAEEPASVAAERGACPVVLSLLPSQRNIRPTVWMTINTTMMNGTNSACDASFGTGVMSGMAQVSCSSSNTSSSKRNRTAMTDLAMNCSCVLGTLYTVFTLSDLRRFPGEITTLNSWTEELLEDT